MNTKCETYFLIVVKQFINALYFVPVIHAKKQQNILKTPRSINFWLLHHTGTSLTNGGRLEFRNKLSRLHRVHTLPTR